MKTKFFPISFKGDSVEIPYIEIKGKKKGPHIFISGGMHGNEINGMAAVDKFLQYAEKKKLAEKLAGKITVFPCLNPSGFAYMQRRVKEDNKDPNRSYGIGRPTTFAEAIAKNMAENFFKHCDLGIDFHDAGGRKVLLPHARVLRNEMSGATAKLGQLFGTQIIIERDGHPNMMAVAMYKKYKVPVLTVELGGAQKIFPDFIDQSLQGILNILSAYGMYKTKIKVTKEQFYLTNRYGIETHEPAQVMLNSKLGDFVHAGDKIGSIYYPHKHKHEDLISPMCGYIFALWQEDQIPKFTTIYSILEANQCHVERTTLKNFKPLPTFHIKQFDFSK